MSNHSQFAVKALSLLIPMLFAQQAAQAAQYVFPESMDYKLANGGRYAVRSTLNDLSKPISFTLVGGMPATCEIMSNDIAGTLADGNSGNQVLELLEDTSSGSCLYAITQIGQATVLAPGYFGVLSSDLKTSYLYSDPSTEYFDMSNAFGQTIFGENAPLDPHLIGGIVRGYPYFEIVQFGKVESGNVVFGSIKIPNGIQLPGGSATLVASFDDGEVISTTTVSSGQTVALATPLANSPKTAAFSTRNIVLTLKNGGTTISSTGFKVIYPSRNGTVSVYAEQQEDGSVIAKGHFGKIENGSYAYASDVTLADMNWKAELVDQSNGAVLRTITVGESNFNNFQFDAFSSSEWNSIKDRVYSVKLTPFIPNLETSTFYADTSKNFAQNQNSVSGSFLASIQSLKITSLQGSYNDAFSNVFDLVPISGTSSYSVKIPDGLGVGPSGYLTISGRVGSSGIQTYTSNVSDGQTVNVDLAFPVGVKAWDIANINITVTKTDGSSVSSTRQAYLLPSANTDVVLTDAKTSYKAGTTFDLNGIVGEKTASTPSVDAKTGQYSFAVYEKVGTVLTKVSDDAITDIDSGTFIFSGLSTDALAGKQLVVRGSPVVPEQVTTGSALPSVTSKVFTFAKAADLGNAIKAASNECTMPCSVRVEVPQTAAQLANTKSVQWRFVNTSESNAGLISGSTGVSTFSPAKGGAYEVYAILTEKLTGETTETQHASIVVHEPPKITVSTVDVALPADTINIKSTVSTPTGKPATLDILNGYRYTTEVYQGDNPTPLIKYQGQTSIDFSPSAVLSGAGLDPATALTNPRFRFVFKASPASLTEDPKSTTVVEKVVVFSAEPPSIDFKLPTLTESGKAITLSSTITPSWKGKLSNLKTVTRWKRNGAEIGTGDRITLTPLAASPRSFTPHNENITVEAWVQGAEGTTFASKTQTLNVFDYVMPTFTLKPSIDSGYAPANLRLILSPADATETKKMAGKQYTYTWNIPEGVVASAKGSMMMGSAQLPGSYPISVTVKDNLENTATYNYTMVIEQMKPYDFSLATKPGLAFERAPMTYLLKPSIAGGHPKDRIKLITLKIDGNVIGTPSAKMPTLISGLEAGSHEISLTIESNFGQTSTATTTVNVAENQPPTLSLLVKPITRTTLFAVIPTYKDPDGKIKKLEWFLDGQATGKSASSMTVDMKSRGATSVSLKVTDDSGASTESSVLIPGL